MNHLATTAVGALTTIATVAAFLLAHAATIRKEYIMIRAEIAQFIASVEALEAAIAARLAQPAPLTPEETAALAAAETKVAALTGTVGAP